MITISVIDYMWPYLWKQMICHLINMKSYSFTVLTEIMHENNISQENLFLTLF